MQTARVYAPDFLYADGVMHKGATLCVSDEGRILETAPEGAATVRLPGKVLVPGLVNAHSHAFQRVLRGRTEFLEAGHAADDFWSWRERMYRAAFSLSPDQLYAVSKQAFLEMALSGITSVGEFHYLHHGPDGRPYADVHELSRQVVRAARDVGLRITLLRVAYARAGHGLPVNPRQARFIEPDVDTYLARTADLARTLDGDRCVLVGHAPHSVRAVPKEWLKAIARHAARPVHIHVAEQPAEIAACLAEHSLRPVELLQQVGLLGYGTTLVHGIHLSPEETARIARSSAVVCACPSTEANLGDGVVEADALLRAGVPVALGSDSQASIDLFSEARRLEEHLRLVRQKRAVLDDAAGRPEGLSQRLWECATLSGAKSLGIVAGTLRTGEWADFTTLDLNHPTLQVADDAALLETLVWSATPAAVSEVAVAGRLIVREGRHDASQSTMTAYRSAVRSLS